ncbi:CRISPR-associated protein Cas6 [Haladaptatus sp. R4]|uniref:CRISPR-associated endoribonuclease Cas6 n=1 Tax=Haladaptatus sp. R4 TaxID=1679489 RepID=UPI0007B4ABC8|nr:CRISPR-associated endoribonuclease Cas6 [Haladaptatus sp. R4]KZN24966.1 CRISPR-associated protein Cas6 [Haladaptatus sp. R4]
MRILARLRARADATYDNCYHHKLRGRLWRALEGTEYDEHHDEQEPTGFCYSNPFPPRNMQEGDKRTLLVSATDRDLLGAIATDLDNNRELNIGEMPFRVTEISALTPDVGEPGTRGVIETGTGVLIRIPPERCEEYGIEAKGDYPTFWRREHTVKPFKTQLVNNLDRKHGLFCPSDLPGPSDCDGNLFNSYELIKTFPLPVTVTQGTEMTYILSKWRLGYEVRDDHHRRHLNLALDTGIGERNALGLGFVNIDEDAVVPAGRAVAETARGSNR